MKSRVKSILSRRNFLTLAGLGLGAAATGCARLMDFVGVIAGVREEQKEKPVVVVGAGLGGLTAAAYLAKGGFPVTVIEQHHVPGGYATSFDRGRFDFEVSLHQSTATYGNTEEVLREVGVKDKVELVPTPELCRVKTSHLDISLPAADPEGVVRVLCEKFPGQEEEIRRFIDMMIAVKDEAATIPYKINLWDQFTFPSKHKVMWSLRGRTMQEVLDEYLTDPELKGVMATFWSYYGLPPSQLSAFYYLLATSQYMVEGGYYYKPRSQALSNAMTEVIEANGGRVILGEEVEQIQMERGRVKGVRLTGGEEYPAQAVVSNASAPVTFNKLIPEGEVSKKYLEKLNGYRPSISSFCVWLGLNKDITDTFKTYEVFLDEHGYNHEAAYKAGVRANPERAQLIVSVYNNLYPEYSDPGTTIVTILYPCGHTPWKVYEKDYFAGNKDAYRAEKERQTRVLIERVEQQLIPGLSTMIEEQVSSTPLTNISFTGNPGGAIYGYEQSVANSYLTRLQPRTPVKGLYLASAWTNPGGGYSGVQYGAQQSVVTMLDDLT